MRILVISAHSDDETFGMGGTILKHIDVGDEVHWLIFTKPWVPKWNEDFVVTRVKDAEIVAESMDLSP